MFEIVLSPWTNEEDERLRLLVAGRASPLRAAAVLCRKRMAVINRARKLGCPFRSISEIRRQWAHAPNNFWRDHEVYKSPTYR